MTNFLKNLAKNDCYDCTFNLQTYLVRYIIIVRADRSNYILTYEREKNEIEFKRCQHKIDR